jgi:hypothetical protein
MERPVDELVQRILGACADDARGRAGRIVSEAIREAEGEVKSLVKSAMKAALLREAAGVLVGGEAAPEEATNEIEPEVQPPLKARSNEDAVLGWYVYGITRSSHKVARELRGVTGAPTEVIERDRVVAVVNCVPLEEFGRALKGEAAQNLLWLEAKARAHDGVLKALLSAGPVVPFRFCTILRSDDDVRATLARHHDAIARTLDEFDGKREWGVKIMFEAGRVSAAGEPDAGDAGGKHYLLNKKRRRDERGEAARAARAKAVECHQQLAALAADAVTLPARRAKEFAEPMELLVNGAYLVADVALDRFRSLVATLAERNREAGLVIEMTGPWPAYNFVRLDLSMEAAA